jgi:hypothetical protein
MEIRLISRKGNNSMDKENTKGNVIADYMCGNTRIVIYDDAIESEEEQELIYERVRGIITRSYLRRQKEKDAQRSAN